MAYTLDTHAAIQDLVATGLTPEQAEAIVATVATSDASLATKGDLTAATGAVTGDLRSEIQLVRTDLQTEIQSVKTELQTEIQSVKTEIQTENKQLRADFGALKAEVKALIAASERRTLLAGLALAGLLFTALRLFG